MQIVTKKSLGSVIFSRDVRVTASIHFYFGLMMNVTSPKTNTFGRWIDRENLINAGWNSIKNRTQR